MTDLRFALRLLAKNPGFTAVAVFTLALGIGANVAIFSVVKSVLLTPLPYPKSEQLVAVFSQFQSLGFDRFWLSPPEYLGLRDRAQSFASLGAYSNRSVNIMGRQEPLRVEALDASSSVFTTLGLKPEWGRFFTPAEDQPNVEPVVVLGAELWRQALGGDPDILGKRVNVDGTDRTVVGIMQSDFNLAGRRVDVWLPLALGPSSSQETFNHYLSLVGRLKEGVSVEAARAELNGILAGWSKDFPNAHTPNLEDHPLVLRLLLDDRVGGTVPALRLLTGAVVFLLLIACTNVASLLLARAESRQREIAIRTAFGANLRRLLRQFLVESFLLTLAAGALGLLLGYWVIRIIAAVHPESIPRVEEIRIDSWSVFFTLLVSLITTLIVGLAPSLHSRTATFFSLKEGGPRTTAGSVRQRIRSALVVFEVALSMVLVITGGLLIHSFWALQQVDLGFQPERVLSFQLSLPETRYRDPGQLTSFYRELVQRLSTLSGVESAAAMSGMPPKREVTAADMDFESVALDPKGPAHNVDYWQFVTHDYFTTLDVPLKQGRLFNHADGKGSPGVVVINETMARIFWPGKNPLGQRLRLGGGGTPWLSIVGIVGDVKQGGLDQKTGSEIYFLHEQAPEALGFAPNTLNVVLRTQVEPTSLVRAVRSTVRDMNPSLPLDRVQTLDQVVLESISQPRFLMSIVIAFAGCALFLAAVGLYGILSFTIEQRAQEIGIRMALGARIANILRMVLGQGTRLVAIGLVLGTALALASGRMISSLLFGVVPTDPLTFAVVILLLSGVAFIACYLPARRAARVDPLVVLKHE